MHSNRWTSNALLRVGRNVWSNVKRVAVNSEGCIQVHPTDTLCDFMGLMLSVDKCRHFYFFYLRQPSPYIRVVKCKRWRDIVNDMVQVTISCTHQHAARGDHSKITNSHIALLHQHGEVIFSLRAQASKLHGVKRWWCNQSFQSPWSF